MKRTLPYFIGLIGSIILIALGTWQVMRLDWKNNLIADANARLAKPYIALPVTPTKTDHIFQRVKVSGNFNKDVPIHVFHTLKYAGQGAWIIAKFTTNDGREILVDRGFVPNNTEIPLIDTNVTLKGALVWPYEVGLFTPEPNHNENLWYGRDVVKMAEYMKTEPIMLQIEPSENNKTWPRAHALSVKLPNNHLQYALTWFGLTIVWIIMSLIWIRRLKR